MKNLLLALLLCLVLGCSKKEPQEEAQDAIKQYLSKNLNDPASYQPVETTGFRAYNKQDSMVFTFPILEKEYKEFGDSIKYKSERHALLLDLGELEEAEKILSSIRGDSARAAKLQSRIDAAKDIDKLDTAKIGFVAIHKYRAKNALNALVLNESIFFFDKQMKVKNVLNEN